ncbi:hypothetical protein [Rhizohabitans arisaemae]|uniref:hypothetical protein n=1 Tax=Rhizohabitans arisaemae TaxID=2720610 RepID=UPI0024B10855|nr:hypothetical protein [Rhizohabitans arisaemae]
MTLHISDTVMVCEHTGRRAERGADGTWSVTGFGRRFDRNQAVTALTLAQALAADPGDPIRAHIADWRAELALPPGGVRA